MKETIGIVGQYGALVMVGFGILYEVVTGAHTGYIVLTTGAWLVALFTKIRGR